MIRKLRPGEKRTERGIVYERLQGDGRWSINIMVNRVRHHQVVGLESQGFTRTQAEELINNLKANKRERAHGVRKSSTVNFKQAAELYIAYLRETGGKDTDKKKQRLDAHLVPHLGGLRLDSIIETDLRRYSTKRTDEGAAPGTINRELAVVSHLFKSASSRQAMNLIPAPPCRIDRLKEAESKPIWLKPDQAKTLLAEAAKDQNSQVLAFAMIGLHTGMRYASILAIRIDELDLERRMVWVDKDKAGERQQPMTADLSEYLETYLQHNVKEGQVFLFPSRRSETGHSVNLYKAFRRVVKAAKLGDTITPHKLRHTMATNAAHAGVDAPTLQAMGGWKSRRMVEKYTHAGAMIDAMDKLQGAYSGAPLHRNYTGKKQRAKQHKA